jgi:hypothetical protein
VDENPFYTPVHRPHGTLSAGVEQEFEVFLAGMKLDFQLAFPAVARELGAVPFRSRDLAAVVDAGYMLACDDTEAEFATAPVDLAGTGALELAGEVARCRESLLDALLARHADTVRGYSTHLNIGLRHGGETALALAVAELAGPSLTLLLEGPESPGLLIRPRPLRLEIGTEYVDSDELVVAGIMLLAGAVCALERGGGALVGWPRAHIERWEMGVMRGGVYLPRDAFGQSIHERGRDTRIALLGGGVAPAGAVLERAASLAVGELAGIVDPRCADVLLRVAGTRGALPVEHAGDVGLVRRRPRRPMATASARLLSAVAASRHAASSPLFVDWHGAAFAVPGRPGMAFGVPWAALASFLDLAYRHALGRLQAALPIGGLLRDLSQLASLGLFRGVDPMRLGDQAFYDFGLVGAK